MNRSAYYKNYYQTNKTKYQELKHCDICKKDVKKFSFTKHLDSQKHKLAERIIDNPDEYKKIIIKTT